MQVSVDSNFWLYGWYEYGYLLDAKDIPWERPLGELLSDEKWLWRDLRYCEQCHKYKPEEAFAGFWFEKDMAKKHSNKIKDTDPEDIQWYKKQCKRCRAQHLFVFLEGRREVLDDLLVNFYEEQPSLGLIKDDEIVTRTALLGKPGQGQEDLPFDKWEDIYARLRI